MKTQRVTVKDLLGTNHEVIAGEWVRLKRSETLQSIEGVREVDKESVTCYLRNTHNGKEVAISEYNYWLLGLLSFFK